MAVNDVLICERVAYLVEQIDEQLNIITSWYPNYDDVTIRKRFSTGWLQLENNTSLMLFEKYITHFGFGQWVKPKVCPNSCTASLIALSIRSPGFGDSP